MALTKEAITRSVFDRLDLSKTASAKAVETTFEIIKKTLEDGEDVQIVERST
jgi:nucleoid DNA-binding protein